MSHRACKKTQLLVWSICSKEVLVIRSKLSVKLQVSSCVGLLYNRNSILWYISCCFVEDVSGPYECSVPLGKEQTMLQGACKKNKTKNSPWIFKWNSYINENYLASITNPPATSYRLPTQFLEQQYEESSSQNPLHNLTSLIAANKHQTLWKEYFGFKKDRHGSSFLIV